MNTSKSKLQPHYDLTVVGGGMVGASFIVSLMSELQQLNSACGELNMPSILIVDGGPAPTVSSSTSHSTSQINTNREQSNSFDSRSTALSFGTAKRLQSLKVLAASSMTSIKHIDVSQQNRWGKAELHNQDYQQDALGYVVENKTLGQGLFKKIKHHLDSDDSSVTWLSQAKVSKVEPMGNAAGEFKLELSTSGESFDKSSLTTGFLILADGAPSKLAEQLGVQFEQFDYGQSALIANIKLSGSHSNWAYERFTDEGPIALLPLSDDRMSVVWTSSHEQAQLRKKRISESDHGRVIADLQSKISGRLGPIEKIGGAVIYPLNKVLSSEQVRRNLVVLGNAAHLLHPVAGQGFNLSFRDSESLVEELVNSLHLHQRFPDLSVLLEWNKNRLIDQGITVAGSHLLPTLFGQSSDAVGLARSMGLTLFDLVSPARDEFARWAMGMNPVQQVSKTS